MKCPNCGGECDRDEVDIGVGVQGGPWGCPDCGWVEPSINTRDDNDVEQDYRALLEDDEELCP
jgi:hypothetical protein